MKVFLHVTRHARKPRARRASETWGAALGLGLTPDMAVAKKKKEAGGKHWIQVTWRIEDDAHERVADGQRCVRCQVGWWVEWSWSLCVVVPWERHRLAKPDALPFHMRIALFKSRR